MRIHCLGLAGPWSFQGGDALLSKLVSGADERCLAGTQGASERDVSAANEFLKGLFLILLFLQLVSATCKDRSMPSVMPSRASANVFTGYMHGSVTDVYLGTGAFLPASPANAMGMRMTVTR